MRFRTAILLATVGLVAAGLVATAIAVARVIEQRGRAQVERDVGRSAEVLAAFVEARQAQYASEARVTAVQPRLTAVVAADEVDHETVLDQAKELAQSLRSAVFVVTDAEGALLADVRYPDEEGADLSGVPVVATALAGGAGRGVWTEAAPRPEAAGHAYLVQSQRIAQGDQTTGALIVGHAVDGELAAAARAQTGSEVAVLMRDKLLAASEVIAGAGAAPLAALRPGVTAELSHAGRTWLAVRGPLPGAQPDQQLDVVVLRDLEAALAASRAAKRVVWIVLGVAVAVAIVLALLLATALSRPVHRLVAFTERVGHGDLDARAEPRGVRELAQLAGSMNRMVAELASSRAAVIEKERLQGELEIATRIQTTVLPGASELSIPGLELAARMIPASEVGGDYYDVVPIPGGGAWIGLGDVSGHGLDAGLMMLMAQTAVATLVRGQPDASPRALVLQLNAVLYEAAAVRMGGERHMTLALLRVRPDGHVALAGAHTDLLLLRADAARCEVVSTPGTFLGVLRDVDAVTVESALELRPGDLLVSCTDGVTEAMNAAGEQFGEARLCEAVRAARGGSAEAIVDAVVAASAAWRVRQDDDVTVLVMRYRGAA